MWIVMIGTVLFAATACGGSKSDSSSAGSGSDVASTATTAPAVDPSTAWVAIRPTLAQPSLETAVLSVGGTPTVVTGVTSPGTPATASGTYPVVVWEFKDGQWGQSLTANVDTPLDTSTGLVVADITGDGQPDIIYGYSSPRFMLNGALSSDGGRWRQLTFDGKPETYQLEPSGTSLTSTYIGDFPDGAGASTTAYRYDRAAGNFVGTDTTPTTTPPPVRPVDLVNGAPSVEPDQYRFGSFAGPSDPLTYQDYTIQFLTPSGNILCSWGTTASAGGLDCDIKVRTSPPPSPTPDCGQISFVFEYVDLSPSEVSNGLCTGGVMTPFNAKVLPYGSVLKFGDYGCISETRGVTCVAFSTGRGFLVSKDNFVAYAP